MAWEAQRDQAVSRRERTTGGIVTAHEPAKHNAYVYKFSVEGKPYTGRETPPNKEPVIGQPVVVYYDPLDPATNALDSFSEKSLQALGLVPTALLGIGGVAVFIFVRRRRPNSQPPAV
jgi:hypothetical protein